MNNSEKNNETLDKQVDQAISNFLLRSNLAVQQKRIDDLISEIDKEDIDLSALEKVLNLIALEDIRFVPIMVCSYAEEVLEQAFNLILPENIPGGRSNIFTGYGPLAGFSKKLQLAYIFEICSPFLVKDIDKIKSVRNKISHGWDLGSVQSLIEEKLADLSPVEKNFDPDMLLSINKIASDKSFALFRIRIIWILGSLFYESQTYSRAKRVSLNPHNVLYCEAPPKRLAKIAKLCYKACKLIN